MLDVHEVNARDEMADVLGDEAQRIERAQGSVDGQQQAVEAAVSSRDDLTARCHSAVLAENRRMKVHGDSSFVDDVPGSRLDRIPARAFQ